RCFADYDTYVLSSINRAFCSGSNNRLLICIEQEVIKLNAKIRRRKVSEHLPVSYERDLPGLLRNNQHNTICNFCKANGGTVTQTHGSWDVIIFCNRQNTACSLNAVARDDNSPIM